MTKNKKKKSIKSVELKILYGQKKSNKIDRQIKERKSRMHEDLQGGL